MSEPISIATRLWFAWLCFFRVLFDDAFAARAWAARAPAELPPAPPKPQATPAPEPEAPSTTAALQLLALLQREGRLVDFLEQDIAGFPDAEIGAAARVVHEGCRAALRAHARPEPVRAEEEGASVTLAPGFDAMAIKLTGNVAGGPPHRGVLRHRGWRVSELRLPTPVDGYDASILAPAELEL